MAIISVTLLRDSVCDDHLIWKCKNRSRYNGRLFCSQRLFWKKNHNLMVHDRVVLTTIILAFLLLTIIINKHKIQSHPFLYWYSAAISISCYNCSSAEDMNCSDLLIIQPDAKLKPIDCSHVIGAKFCVKSTALDGQFHFLNKFFSKYV